MQELRPTPGTQHGPKKTFVYKDLATADCVFLRHDGPKSPLQKPYDGPFKVIKRSEKTFVINVRGRDVTVTIERLKPAFIVSDDLQTDDEPQQFQQPEYIVVPTPTNQGSPTVKLPTEPNEQLLTTRSGRRVRFPDRLQVGFP
jgi:hypothetical protein